MGTFDWNFVKKEYLCLEVERLLPEEQNSCDGESTGSVHWLLIDKLILSLSKRRLTKLEPALMNKKKSAYV